MVLRQWSAVGIALAAMIGPAQSGPFGSTGIDFRRAGEPASSFEKVAYRLCVTEGGVVRCRWVEIYGYQSPRVYGYQSPIANNPPVTYGYTAPVASNPPPVVYGYRAPLPNNPPVIAYGADPPIAYRFRPSSDYIETDPDAYPVGTTPWWQNMDRQARGGRAD